jgi:hypothetical protein
MVAVALRAGVGRCSDNGSISFHVVSVLSKQQQVVAQQEIQ